MDFYKIFYFIREHEVPVQPIGIVNDQNNVRRTSVKYD